MLFDLCQEGTRRNRAFHIRNAKTPTPHLSDFKKEEDIVHTISNNRTIYDVGSSYHGAGENQEVSKTNSKPSLFTGNGRVIKRAQNDEGYSTKYSYWVYQQVPEVIYFVDES